jgi:SAM-dependent methyltransferase
MEDTTKKAVEAAFDDRLANAAPLKYSFERNTLARKDRAIVDFLRALPVSGRRCLDVGPGTGRWLEFLKSEGARSLAAVDISSESLKRCARLCDAVHKADLERDRLEFPDDSFDLTVSFEVMEHLLDPSVYLSELIRVTRPGGTLLFSVPNVVSLISRARMILGVLPPAISNDPTHVRHYRKADVASLFARFGLRPVFMPTSFSINPLEPKSRLRVPSCRLTSSLDDSLLFHAVVPERPPR